MNTVQPIGCTQGHLPGTHALAPPEVAERGGCAHRPDRRSARADTSVPGGSDPVPRDRGVRDGRRAEQRALRADAESQPPTLRDGRARRKPGLLSGRVRAAAGRRAVGRWPGVPAEVARRAAEHSPKSHDAPRQPPHAGRSCDLSGTGCDTGCDGRRRRGPHRPRRGRGGGGRAPRSQDTPSDEHRGRAKCRAGRREPAERATSAVRGATPGATDDDGGDSADLAGGGERQGRTARRRASAEVARSAAPAAACRQIVRRRRDGGRWPALQDEDGRADGPVGSDRVGTTEVAGPAVGPPPRSHELPRWHP